jgi:deoxycytidine triphosphate deaminase
MKVLKDLVKILQKEKHDLIQKFEESEQQLQDSKSDLRLLREQLGYYTKDS